MATNAVWNNTDAPPSASITAACAVGNDDTFTDSSLKSQGAVLKHSKMLTSLCPTPLLTMFEAHIKAHGMPYLTAAAAC